MSRMRAFVPQYRTAICSPTGIGLYWGWMRSWLFLRPLSRAIAVTLSMSEENLEKASSSAYWAWSIFRVPATFFMDLTCALPPTRETLIPTLIAGRIPWLNKPDSR